MAVMVGNQGESKSLITALVASGEMVTDDARIWDDIIEEHRASRDAPASRVRTSREYASHDATRVG